ANEIVRQLNAGEPSHVFRRECDLRTPFGCRALDDRFGRFAAAEFEDELRREFESRHHELRIGAPFEAVTGVGLDAELAPRGSDALRIKPRGFDEDIARVFRTSRILTAHD